MVIVIPAYKEPEIKKSVHSLLRCTNPCKIAIIILINESEKETAQASKINQKAYEEIRDLNDTHLENVDIFCTYIKMPAKKAGVGLARKIGMDEATWWFNSINKNGILICFDADSTCHEDYLTSIYQSYKENNLNGGVVSYKHPLENRGIIDYETYLRYYTGGLRLSGFPYAFQTLGSCITVRSDVYMKQGGMNTRKAGEDFYFLHKVIPLGKFTDIKDAEVYPSARISDRVPFGTGSALAKYDPTEKYKVYHPQIFHELKSFFQAVLSEEKLPKSVTGYFDDLSIDFEKVKMNSRCNNFSMQFYQWFDGFKVLKMVHYLRDHHFGTMEVSEATTRLNKDLWNITDFSEDPEKRLKQIRKWEYDHPLFLR